MKRIAILLSICGFAFGSNPPRSIPVPHDPLGAVPFMKQADWMADGTLLVADSADRVWWSRDTGRNWDTVPDYTKPSHRYDGSGFAGWSPFTPTIFWGSVLSKSKEGYWTPDSGWQDVRSLDSCLPGSDESWLDPPGFMGSHDATTGKSTFCRSSDGGRSWQVWFSLDSSEFRNATSRRPPEFLAAGMIWLRIADSGCFRGTGDGSSWHRIDPPSPYQPGQLQDCGPKCLALLPAQPGTGAADTALVSHDTGRSWSRVPLSQPGIFVFPSFGGYSSVSIRAPDRFDSWVSPSSDGPWIFADSSASWMDVLDNFWLGGTPYRVQPESITRIETSGTGIAARIRSAPSDRRRFLVVAERGIQSNRPGTRTFFVDPSGRVLPAWDAAKMRVAPSVATSPR